MKLELNDLTCGYGEKAVVRNINLTMQGGEICCILGQNGVGKSTVFQTLLRLLPPISGSVHIDGEDIRKWSIKKMACYCAYVAQSHAPSFPYPVKDVVLIGRAGMTRAFSGPSGEDRELAMEIMRDLQIAELADEPYTQISGGERQLVMIGRALAQRPQCLVLDEPTANLDYGNKIIVLNTLKRLAEKGFTVIFTTHDPEHALLLDAKTLVLFKNAPAVVGSAREVVNDKALKAAYNADIRVVEILDDHGKPVRVCLPMLR